MEEMIHRIESVEKGELSGFTAEESAKLSCVKEVFEKDIYLFHHLGANLESNGRYLTGIDNFAYGRSESAIDNRGDRFFVAFSNRTTNAISRGEKKDRSPYAIVYGRAKEASIPALGKSAWERSNDKTKTESGELIFADFGADAGLQIFEEFPYLAHPNASISNLRAALSFVREYFGTNANGDFDASQLARYKFIFIVTSHGSKSQLITSRFHEDVAKRETVSMLKKMANEYFKALVESFAKSRQISVEQAISGIAARSCPSLKGFQIVAGDIKGGASGDIKGGASGDIKGGASGDIKSGASGDIGTFTDYYVGQRDMFELANLLLLDGKAESNIGVSKVEFYRTLAEFGNAGMNFPIVITEACVSDPSLASPSDWEAIQSVLKTSPNVGRIYSAKGHLSILGNVNYKELYGDSNSYFNGNADLQSAFDDYMKVREGSRGADPIR